MADREGSASSLSKLREALICCRRCPRLVEWREAVAREKRASYADQDYWGRPVPGFGDPKAWLLVVGLAPAAHGANRTGRMFTGDRSGAWLHGALHRAGLASQAESTHRSDGLVLHGVWVTAVVRCAPPGNRPLAAERDECARWLDAELDLLDHVRVVVALGRYSYDQTLRLLAGRGVAVPRPRPKFAHGRELDLGDQTLLASYHPSQQNTFTKRLTEPMFDAIWARAFEMRGGV